MNTQIARTLPVAEGGPNAYARQLHVAFPLVLEELTVLNKAAAIAYVQLYDTARKIAVPITGSAVEPDNHYVVETGHGFQNGDAVTLTGVTGGPLTGYLYNIDATHISTHATRAEALVGANPDVPPSAAETGVLDLTSNLALVPEEFPLAAAANAPSNFHRMTVPRQFNQGLYLRGVTAGGGTTVSGADLKFAPRYRRLPVLAATPAYLD